MKIGISPLERAFEIARSGTVSGVEKIKRALKNEGYDTTEVHGPLLSKQLRSLGKAAREKGKEPAISVEELNASNDK